MKKFFAVRNQPLDIDIVLLLIRMVCGYTFILHGWGKIQDPFHWAGDQSPFPTFLLGLAALSEFGGGLAWVAGLLTRLAAFGIACTMIVAVYMHSIIMGDPLVSLTGGRAFELAAVYFLIALLLLIAGPGRFSLDRKLFGNAS